jgi:recombinational DNA repair protein (RecF pathway)
VHQVLETDALILGGAAVGERDRVVALLSPELGLVRTRVRGVRQISSKLRGSLEDWSLVRAYLVRGKGEWRLTNVVLLEQHFPALLASGGLASVSRAARLVARLAKGEGDGAALFPALLSLARFAATPRDHRTQDAAETVCALRVLRGLGYLRETPSLEPLATADSFDEATAEIALGVRAEAVNAINEALAASHL